MISSLLLFLSSPAVPDDLLLCAFQSNSVTRHDARTGNFEGDFNPSPTGTLGATIGPDGHLYVCSESDDRVLRYDAATGTPIDVFIFDDPNTGPDETGGLDGPSAIAFPGDGRVYVASFNTDAVLRYDARTGVFFDVFVQPGEGNLNGPDAGMAFGPDAHLYVPSFFSHQVKRFDGTSGVFLGNLIGPAQGLRNPRAVVFHPDGSIYVTSEGTDQVYRCDIAGGGTCLPLVFDDPNTTPDETGGLDRPTGIDFASDGNLAVASLNTNEVLKYRRGDGLFLGVLVTAGSGGNDLPTHLLFRPAVTKYCDPAPNSAGAGAQLSARGWTSLTRNELELIASYGPSNQPALFYFGRQAVRLPFGNGFRCVIGSVRRLPMSQLDGSGSLRQRIDLDAVSPPRGPIRAGTSWNFQLWFRDPAGGGAGFNTSDGLGVHFRS